MADGKNILGSALKGAAAGLRTGGALLQQRSQEKQAKEKEADKLRQALANRVQVLTELEKQGDVGAGRELEITERFGRPLETGESKQFRDVFAQQADQDEAMIEELAQRFAAGTQEGAPVTGLTPEQFQPFLEAPQVGGGELERLLSTLPGASADIAGFAQRSVQEREIAERGIEAEAKAAVAPAERLPKQIGIDRALAKISELETLEAAGRGPTDKPPKPPTMESIIKATKADLISDAEDIWRKVPDELRKTSTIQNITSIAGLNKLLNEIVGRDDFNDIREQLSAIASTFPTVGNTEFRKNVRPQLNGKRGRKPLFEPTEGQRVPTTPEQATTGLTEIENTEFDQLISIPAEQMTPEQAQRLRELNQKELGVGG